MKVKNWIHKKPITIDRQALLQDAVQLMKDHNIRHLPVMDADQMVGFVTESDVRQFSFPSMVEEIPIHQVMLTNPLTIDAEDSIEVAARMIKDNKIGGLPVVKGEELVGVITYTDILSAFIQVIGMLSSTSRIDVVIDDKKNKNGVHEVSTIIQEHGCKIINMAVDNENTSNKVYYFRLEQTDVDPVVSSLESAGYTVLSATE